MRSIFCLLCLSAFLFPAPLSALETAPRISDREIVERLARVETAIQTLHESIGQLRADMNQLRIENRADIHQLREDMNAQFDRISNHRDVLLGVFAALTAATIGFAVWDRRTMVRPSENKVKSMEASLVGNTERLNALLEALRAAGKTDPNTAEVLPKFHLL